MQHAHIRRNGGATEHPLLRRMACNGLVIPCHRIVAAGGIGGFSSPVEIKEALLAMEKKGLRKELK
jgi:methylated-DNA-[protein]-cysteine S-methyltransferase